MSHSFPLRNMDADKQRNSRSKGLSHQPVKHFSTDVDAQIETTKRVLELVNESGLSITQVNGQRKLGPPPNWIGPPPSPKCEVFVGKLPRDVDESEIYPIFRRIGEIYEIRLMMDFSGTNRGYCFVMYTNARDAQRAIQDLNSYEIRNGRRIGVLASVNNCRLCVSHLPRLFNTEAFIKKIFETTSGVEKVSVYRLPDERPKNALIFYKTHIDAAMARRRLVPERSNFIHGAEITVDWAHPNLSPENVIEQKAHMKIQHDNHVSQISKSIQSQTNHINSHQNHNNQSRNQLNHTNCDSNHSPGNRMASHSVGIIQANGKHGNPNGQCAEWRQPEEINKSNEESIYESGPVINDGKHSLLQFAILNFRQSTEKFEMMKTADGSISGSLKVIESLKNKKKSKKTKGQHDGTEWTWKEQVDLVKFSQVPIEQSLLRLEGEMSSLAVECFSCLMRYMADQPLPPDMSEVKCVYTILMHCHRYEPLRDEVYCQLMKQTTNNKSSNPDSCQRGWRLFSIVAAYFTCSENLRPYLIKYLETAAYDKRRAYHGTATVCLQNLRKTVKYGGRKNVPSVEEIMAISAGRNAKRQIYRLPGGTERVINTKCTTVVQDVIEEMCNIISVRNPHEMDEFSLYCIVDGDAFTMPLARDEYVLDVTTELHKNHQVFYLIFCRSVWYYPLRLDAALYIEVVFNQIAPDYLEGLLLVIPGEHLSQQVIYDMAQIAALLHRAADMPHEPSTKEIKYLLPKPALSLREPRPQQWGNMVQQAWNNIQDNTPAICKAQVLEILSKWPLFGSSFFAVKRVPESGKEKVGDHILALNRHGVHFIDLITHETLYHYPYSEVISTRKVKSEEGALYLDMKCGNLMQQRITRLQTEQAHEISRLIRQYITMEQRTTNNQASSTAYGLR